jgi:hopene-associated glycosyltransferase HpnB
MHAGTVAAALPVLIWLYLLCARGRFWLVKPALAPGDSDSAGSRLVGTHAPRIAVVIPARNEVSVIAGTITSLLAQDFPGSCEIFVVDDNSSDGTADAALAAGRGSVTVLNAPSPPAGWTGKMWALSHGVERALAAAPDFLLFTDADIHHAPDSLQKLTAIAADGRFDLVSFMVKLRCDTFAERALIPAFVFFFFLLYPPPWIRNPKRKTAGAAGGCILITPAILRKAGGIEAIRGEVIDDCALARRVKSAGGRIWLGLTEETASTRSYETFGEIEKMIARTAFRQLNHSALLLAGTVAGLAITYLLPVALLFTGRPAYALPGLAAWALMTITYLPMVRFYQLSPLWAPLLPAVALFYTASTIHSAFKYWTGRGGEWKGRVQDSGVEG